LTVLLLAGSSFLTRGPKVSIRPAGTSDTQLFRPISLLVAESILKPESQTDLAIFAAALQRDIQDRFTQRNRMDNELILAENEDGEVVGVVGIDVQQLSRKALNADRLGRYSEELDDRPLLSSLAVRPDYRRRGIAVSLCKEADKTAKRWGYSEVVLKVEANNSKARNLYRRLGYRVVGTDKEAERPVISGGLRFVQTTQVAMRKSLTLPPLDTVATAGAATLAAYYASNTFPAELAQAKELVAAGRVEQLIELVRSVASSL